MAARGAIRAWTLTTMDLDLTGLSFRPQILDSGVAEHELRRTLRYGQLKRLRPGAYVRADHRDLNDRVARHALLVSAAVPALSAGAVISHTSAAVLHGLPIWNLQLERVHASRQRRSGDRRGRLLHVHAAPWESDEVVLLDGKAVTSVARTVVDVARLVPFEQAVVVADGALHHDLVTPSELDAALERAAHRRGNTAARRVMAFADGRSESVGESRSRVAIHRAGLEPPTPQWAVLGVTGRLVGRVDFGWPPLRAVGEFDGCAKYGRFLGPGQAPADVVIAEKLREDRLRDEGLRVVRWTWSELDTFAIVAARLERAFAGR